MEKKINIEVEIKGSASGFNKAKHKVFEPEVCAREKKELGKVFSGEDFGM